MPVSARSDEQDYLRDRARAAAIWRARTEFVKNCQAMSFPDAKRILDDALRAADEEEAQSAG